MPSKNATPRPPAGSLAEAIRVGLADSRPGFKPWYERLTPEQRAEVEAVKAQWLAGQLGKHRKPLAELISRYLKDQQICDVGTQGVIQWLRKA